MDSSGRLSEIYAKSDSFSLMGHFDRCLSVRAPSFRGQFCTANVLMPLSTRQSNHLRYISIFGSRKPTESDVSVDDSSEMKLVDIGMCIPSSCTATDLQAALQDSVMNHPFRFNISVTTKEDFCSIQSDEWFAHFDTADIAVL